MFEDDMPDAARNRAAIIPGEDLSAFSLEDLKERREKLVAEIARIDAVTEKKQAGKQAADAIFKL